MKRLVETIALLLALALVPAPRAAAADHGHGHGHGARKAGHPAEAQLREGMRKLWEDHVTYTAFFYTAAIQGGDDAGVLAARLLRNQDDIGNAVKPFYGEAAGNRLAALLRDHILIAADLVKAAVEGKGPAQEEAARRWSANGDEIAAFLAAANPHWSRQALADMMRAHLAVTTDAVVAKLHKDTAAAIAAYDKGHEHILMMADALSEGIIRQFPQRFRPGA